MSKLITNTLRHTGGSADNITLDNSQNVTCENDLQVDGDLTVTGTIPANKLTGTAAAINGSNITNLPAANLTGTLPAISGANLTNLPASSSPSAFRRLNHNGAMTVNQYVSTALAHDGTETGFGADRYYAQMASMDELHVTVTTVDDGPATDLQFQKAFKLTTTTAESAIAANEALWVSQGLDGVNLQTLKWGTASAEQVTIRFWVKSSITGTFSCTLYSARSSGSRIVNKSYAISAANTWEQKTINFPADTGGNTIPNTKDRYLQISWGLASGSSWDGSSSETWVDYTLAHWLGLQATDAVATTANATWLLTGVQLETGDSATDYEWKSFPEELAICQRYYCHTYPYGTAITTNTHSGSINSSSQATTTYASPGWFSFPTTMRDTPSCKVYSPHSGTKDKIAADSVDGNGAIAYASTSGCFPYRNNDNSGVSANSFIKAHVTASAEMT